MEASSHTPGTTPWGRVGYSGATLNRTGMARFLPPRHLPARIPLQQGAFGVGVSWAVRVHAGREEPAHDSAQVRGALSDGVVLAKELEPCVSIRPAQAWRPVHRPRDLVAATPSARRRATSSAATAADAFDGQLDAAGRVMLPPPLIEHAGLAQGDHGDRQPRLDRGLGPRALGRVRSRELTRRRRSSRAGSPRAGTPDGPGTATVTLVLDMTRTHVPVLAGELIDALDPAPGAVAVDCTFGAGGHARLVADRHRPGGRDRLHRPRPARRGALRRTSRPRSPCATRFIARRLRRRAARAARARGSRRTSLYLDLGISSMQVDARERGFSYSYDAPLDMRMDPSAGARRAHGRERVAGGAARRDLPRVRRGALRAPHRARDRAPPRARADRDHDRAGRRDQARGPDAGAVRRRASRRGASSRRSGSPSTTSSGRSSARCPRRGSCCARAAGWPRSPSTRSRTGW